MKLYKPFIIAFIVSAIAMVVFFIAHFQMFFSLINEVQTNEPENPAEIFSMMLSPMWIGSLILLILSSVTYQVLGIIMIAKNPNIDSTDRVLWILGFVFMAFITAIIFMALQKSKNLTSTEYIPKRNPWDAATTGMNNPYGQ